MCVCVFPRYVKATRLYASSGQVGAADAGQGH